MQAFAFHYPLLFFFFGLLIREHIKPNESPSRMFAGVTALLVVALVPAILYCRNEYKPHRNAKRDPIHEATFAFYKNNPTYPKNRQSPLIYCPISFKFSEQAVLLCIKTKDNPKEVRTVYDYATFVNWFKKGENEMGMGSRDLFTNITLKGNDKVEYCRLDFEIPEADLEVNKAAWPEPDEEDENIVSIGNRR